MGDLNKIPWPVWAFVTLGAAGLSAFAVLHQPIAPSPAPPPPAGQAASTGPATKADRYSVRLSNCDDGGEAYVNGILVGQVGFGGDSGPIDITDRLKPGDNTIEFHVVNTGGTITYTFEVMKNDVTIFRPTCGFHHQEGCENNRGYPV